MDAVRDPPHGGGDDSDVGGRDGACGEFGGGGRQRRGQQLPGQRPAWGEQRGMLDPGARLALREVEHPGQQPGGGAESRDRTRLLFVQLIDHPEDPGIGLPEVGLGVAQRVEQPVDPGLRAILLHRGHPPILASTTDNFGPSETTPERKSEIR